MVVHMAVLPGFAFGCTLRLWVDLVAGGRVPRQLREYLHHAPSHIGARNVGGAQGSP